MRLVFRGIDSAVEREVELGVVQAGTARSKGRPAGECCIGFREAGVPSVLLLGEPDEFLRFWTAVGEVVEGAYTDEELAALGLAR